MRKKRNPTGSTRSAEAARHRLELPPERAFVVQLAAQAELPRRVLARVEHITSGQVAHVASTRELIAFMAAVLRRRNDQEIQ